MHTVLAKVNIKTYFPGINKYSASANIKFLSFASFTMLYMYFTGLWDCQILDTRSAHKVWPQWLIHPWCSRHRHPILWKINFLYKNQTPKSHVSNDSIYNFHMKSTGHAFLIDRDDETSLFHLLLDSEQQHFKQ